MASPLSESKGVYPYFPIGNAVIELHVQGIKTKILTMIYTAILTKDSDGGYIAQNPETGTTTQGSTFDEALANLREATELFLEEFPSQTHSPALMTTFEVADA